MVALVVCDHRMALGWLQRPSAKALLSHPFIKKAKKTSYLTDLIDRYKRYRLEHGPDVDSDDSDNDSP